MANLSTKLIHIHLNKHFIIIINNNDNITIRILFLIHPNISPVLANTSALDRNPAKSIGLL